MKRFDKEAEMMGDAIRKMAENEDNVFNFVCYLTYHFDTWLRDMASTPQDLATEMKCFAEMEV